MVFFQIGSIKDNCSRDKSLNNWCHVMNHSSSLSLKCKILENTRFPSHPPPRKIKKFPGTIRKPLSHNVCFCDENFNDEWKWRFFLMKVQMVFHPDRTDPLVYILPFSYLAKRFQPLILLASSPSHHLCICTNKCYKRQVVLESLRKP